MKAKEKIYNCLQFILANPFNVPIVEQKAREALSLLNSESNDERSVATGAQSSEDAGIQKLITSLQECISITEDEEMRKLLERAIEKAKGSLK